MNFEDLNLPDSPYRGYYVNNGGATVSIDNLDLISHVTDNLYVGGCVGGVDLSDFFTHVYSMYKWEQYKVAPSTQVHTVTMYDSPDEVDPETVHRISDAVVEALKDGGNVLVHCQAGINRSNLIASLALMKWKGLSAPDAIALLREKRSPIALANKTFESFVLGQG